jgi:hypothetical protein
MWLLPKKRMYRTPPIMYNRGEVHQLYYYLVLWLI